MNSSFSLSRMEKCVLRQSRLPLWRRVLCGLIRGAFPLASLALILKHVATQEAIWGFFGYTLLLGRLLWMVGQACRSRRAVRGLAAKYEERLAVLSAELATAKAAV